ncbi:threonine--tRNA ligase [Rhodopseudomonas pseudopalustris]|uniref:Threonine--tRNA ligase n=1 Tax=Rhodopseudomonas pseudopalustris TaxID=1513892 RepID=A0A1H8Q4T0_9BRAD|nr:threonine--tRNA ligase [Rhodopseudomonas pseudopalustris]SEO48971.1 Ser-tRNA(Thr) hydrolase /threonyl-tRNA synthetase [Rhodopseudomonas pseudopalustris]
MTDKTPADKNLPAGSGFQYTLSNLKPAVNAEQITVTFPDGKTRDYPRGTTGLEIAKGISPSLAKRTVVMALNGVLTDLADPIDDNAAIDFVARDDSRALELIRHDCAHVLAEAVQALWPGTQVTIGPTIENGFYYDFFRNEPFTPEDFAAIEKKMREIIARDKPFTKEVWTRDQTKQVFADNGEMFKVELVDAIPADQSIKIYKQGDWFDLCRGPHMTSTGKIGSAFKLMKVAGAYWRGDSNNPMLTRIYGTAFAKQEDLDAYLKQIEEAEKRDHRRLGRELDLFHFQEEGPGVVFWHAKGWSVFQSLVAYMRRRLAGNYDEVNAPQILDKVLWETSGHWDWYRENMFAAQSAGENAEDKRWFALKPMNCPGHVQIFKHGLKSYRDLPLRMAEFGIVHRYEPSGAMHGLMRVRGFTQDDAHVFCTEAQLAEECLKINDLILSTYSDFGFDGELTVKLSTRPDKRVGTDEMWDHAERVMATVLSEIKAQGDNRIKTEINPGEGAFYGPKFEYVLRDAIGRDWQCGTTQVDFNLPERFGAFYIDADGAKKAPVMVHRAICGSMERFIGILIEHFAGNFPLWLAPVQLVVATITSEGDEYAKKVVAAARRAGLRVDIDLRNEKINLKVREHSLAKVPALLVVGKKEAETHSVSVRRLGSDGQTVMATADAIAALVDEATPPDVKRMRAQG